MLEEKLRQIIQDAMDAYLVAGANFLVKKDGEEVVYVQAGMADCEKGRPLTRDTIFRLYSQTKPVTAAAAMLLVERGQLDLCQPVAEYLPEYANQKVAVGQQLVQPEAPMLVHDLLRMTSGLLYPDDTSVAGAAVNEVYKECCERLHGEHPMSTRELAGRLGKCPLAFMPGKGWRYGTSADVLGAIIEVVAGMSLSEFMRKELFEPLQMKDTGFYVPEEKQNRLAAAYTTTVSEDGRKGRVRYQADHLGVSNAMTEEPAYAAGGAGLCSTLDDYMRFAQMLLRGGELEGVRILHPETVRYMTGGQLMPGQQQEFDQWLGLNGFSYGNLMRVCKNPGQAGFLTREGEYGWDGWLGMYFANFPRENMTILMGTQKTDAGTFSLTRKLRNAFLAQL